MAPTFPKPIKIIFLSILLLINIKIAYGQPNQSILVFYMQDVGKGPNATVLPIIGIKDKVWSYNTFGTIFAVDDPITLTSSPLQLKLEALKGENKFMQIREVLLNLLCKQEILILKRFAPFVVKRVLEMLQLSPKHDLSKSVNKTSTNYNETSMAQGTITVTSQDGANVNIVLSIVFNNVQYAASTLEIQGTSRQRDNLRELGVVSGTGRFRFARGFAVFETISYNPTSTQSIIRLTVTLTIP
ncbi:hypothetical protein RYX36_037087 [Vicia faba]